MARSPDFLQQSFVTNDEKKNKAKEIDLEDIGEDNLSALELYLHNQDQENSSEAKRSQTPESNGQPSPSNTPKDDPCVEQENEQSYTTSKTSSKRCCSSVMIAVFIVISLGSLFIDVLVIKGVIVPSGCLTVDSRKGTLLL